MVCVYCGGETRVINSRAQKRDNQTWRRRACLTCKAVFTTEESVLYRGSISVKRKDGSFQPFSRDKLFFSIFLACGHRKDALAAASALTDTVVSRIIHQIKSPELPSGEIVKLTSSVLKKFDKAAYAQYSAYHPVNA